MWGGQPCHLATRAWSLREPVSLCGGATPFLGPGAESLCSCVYAVAGSCAGACHMSQCRSLGVSVGANSWGLVCMGVVLRAASLGHLELAVGVPGSVIGSHYPLCVDQGCVGLRGVSSGVFLHVVRGPGSAFLGKPGGCRASGVVCAHVCRCFWVVALVCMLCVVGMCLWVCFGSACVSGACMRVGLYSVCGEAPVRRFSGTRLPVSQLFRTESFPRPLYPHIFLLRPHSPLRLSLQGSVSQRQRLRLRVACPFLPTLGSCPAPTGVG